MNNNRLGKMTTLLLVVFFLVYTVYQTFRFFFTSYATENAYIFQVARVYTTNGLLLREEAPVAQNHDGALRYVLPEGGKFIAQTPIAIRYSSDEAAQLAEEYEALEKERTVLLEAQRKATSSVKPNIAELSNDIYTTLREHTLATTADAISDVDTIKLELLRNITAIQTSVNSTVSYQARIAKLDEEIAKAEQGSEIHLNQTGYFSRYSDGQETTFNPQILETITIGSLEQYLSQDYPYVNNTFGKCMTDYNWYYVTTIPLKEVELFQPGVKMNLTFVGSDEKAPVSGWVHTVTEDRAAGKALLVIQSNDINEDTVSRRTATVKLGFDDYLGVRFSKKALRIHEGVQGVYVRGKSSIQFKKVDIIYNGMDFYLSKLDYNSKTHLNIFDEIVVEGTNLYDGKPLEQ